MSLNDATTEELAKELSRRQREEIAEFIRQAPLLADDLLTHYVKTYDCDFVRVYEYQPPDDHCVGCAAQHELDERADCARRAEQEQPGARPNNCMSCRSGYASELKQNDVLERRLYPGADEHDYVQVLAIHSSKDGGKFRLVRFQRTNDPESDAFGVTYPADTHISCIWSER